MGIANVKRNLPSNRMIFEVRRDTALMEQFREDLEAVMERYGLGEAEKAAWRAIDIHQLGDLGVHPYYLPQVSRMFRGSAYNHNRSDAARLYARTMVDTTE